MKTKFMNILLVAVMISTLLIVNPIRIQAAVENIALNKPVTVSSTFPNRTDLVASNLVDGSLTTRWGSKRATGTGDNTDNTEYGSVEQWIQIDLGEVTTLTQMKLHWEGAYAKTLSIHGSADGVTFTKLKDITKTNASMTDLGASDVGIQALRYIKIELRTSTNQNWGYSLFEIEVYDTFEPTAQSVLAEAEAQQAQISGDCTSLILPTLSNSDYTISLYGSDTQEVIALDGTITKPISTMDVNLLYKVVNKIDPNDVAYSSQDINIVVPGLLQAAPGDNLKPSVLPAIREWKGGNGNFILNDSSKISVGDASLIDTANQIKFYFKEMLKREIEVTTDAPKIGDISLVIDNTVTPSNDEGYKLEIGDKVEILANNAKGILYGGITITQILNLDDSHQIIPKGIARDYPKYAVRSGMIDVGRVYIPLEYLEEMTLYMSWFKMNEVQVHVNDYWGAANYSAFRLESDRYPEIVAKDGYYTKDAYRDYQIRMKEFGIDVITEIDTPYHSEFMRNVPGVKMLKAGAIDIRDEATVQTILNLLDEYLDGPNPVIQSKSFHIGTDEYDKSLSEQMRGYTDRLIKYVNAKGYETRLWGSLGTKGFNGTTPVSNDAVMNIWAPYWSDVHEMYDAGYDIINTVGGWLYIVPGSNAGYPDRLNLETLYENFDVNNFSPNRNPGNGTAIMPIAHPQTIGAEFAIWNDVTTFKGGFSDFDIFDRVVNAVMITSEKTWYGEKTQEQTTLDFLNRVQLHSKQVPGANPGRYVSSTSDIIAKYSFDSIEDGLVVDLSGNNYSATVHNGMLVNEGFGKVLNFNGDGYLKLPFNSVGFPYTVSFDVKLSDIPANTILFSGKDGTLYANFKGTNKLALSRGEEGIYYEFQFNYSLPLEEWVNITLRQNLTYKTGGSDRNSNKSELYINGKALGEPTKLITSSRNDSTTFVLPTEEIMKNVKGSIDNLIIFNRTLSNDEILELIDMKVVPNLSKEGTVSYSGVEGGRNTDNTWKYPQFVGENVIDGDKETRWSAPAESDEQWLIVDLEDTYRISEIIVDFHALTSHYEILVSEDGITYESIYTYNDPNQARGTIKAVHTIDATEKVARYIKYVQHKRWVHDTNGRFYGSSIYEIEVYGIDKLALIDHNKQLINLKNNVTTYDAYHSSLKTAITSTIDASKAVIDNNLANNAQVLESLNSIKAILDAITMNNIYIAVDGIVTTDLSSFDTGSTVQSKAIIDELNLLIVDRVANRVRIKELHDQWENATLLHVALDKAKLSSLIRDAEALNMSLYVTNDFKVNFMNTLSDAKDMIDTATLNSDLEKQFSALSKAIADLQLIKTPEHTYKLVIKDLLNLGTVGVDFDDNAFDGMIFTLEVGNPKNVEEFFKTILEELSKKLEDTKMFADKHFALSITPKDENGQKIQLKNGMSLLFEIDIPEYLRNSKEIRVYHINEDGTYDLLSSEIDGKRIRFTITSFSDFALVGINDIQNNIEPNPGPQNPLLPTTGVANNVYLIGSLFIVVGLLIKYQRKFSRK